MKKLSLFTLAAVMTVGALNAGNEQKPTTQTPPPAGFLANALETVKGLPAFVPFTANQTWTNFGKTAAAALALYAGYKAYKFVACDDCKNTCSAKK